MSGAKPSTKVAGVLFALQDLLLLVGAIDAAVVKNGDCRFRVSTITDVSSCLGQRDTSPGRRPKLRRR